MSIRIAGRVPILPGVYLRIAAKIGVARRAGPELGPDRLSPPDRAWLVILLLALATIVGMLVLSSQP